LRRDKETTLNAVTSRLAEYVLTARLEDIPQDVRKEARRALVNYVGCALGGSRHEAMDITLAALGPLAGPATAAILGRAERTDPMLACLLNGISSHVHDYDDTTPRNYIHPSSPVASALFAYASGNRVSGAELELAFIMGFEAVSRIGNATYPAHYDAGWHSTGSIGVFGSAIAIGRLLGLSQRQMVWAIGLAATQSCGLREMFGSMAKSFHPGRSAQSGYLAALLAQKNFTAGEKALEGPRGFAAVQSSEYDLARITDRLGDDFELRVNAYKPFPCGIVVHPTIDACIQLRERHRIDPQAIAAVRLRVAPLVKDLCDKRDISTGLEGKFSAYHAAAIGLVKGKAGLGEFTDETVNEPLVRQVRMRVESTGDPAVSEDGVQVEVELADGGRFRIELEHSLGNLKRPLSDAQLEAKFLDQSGVLSPAQARELIAACWRLEELDDVAGLAALAVPAA
jgi:2-methylcitrate dehydratase PrpD